MRKGFTLIELLVVIAIIAILAAILFPVFAKAREKARQSSCLSNVKQISLAFMQYVQDYDERFPGYAFGSSTVDPWICWPNQMQAYIKNWQVYACPSSPYNNRVNYTYHGVTYPQLPCYAPVNSLWSTAGGIAMASIVSPSTKWLLADSNHAVLGDIRGYLTSAACGQWGCGRNVNTTHIWEVVHNEGINIGFCDGHAKWLQANTAWGAYSAGAMSPTTP